MPRRARSAAPDPPGLEPARLNRALNQCPRRRSRSSLTCLRRATQAARPRPRMLNPGLRPSRHARRPSHPARRLRSADPAFLRRRPLLPSSALRVPPWRGHAPCPIEPRPHAPPALAPVDPGLLDLCGPLRLGSPQRPLALAAPPPGSLLCGGPRGSATSARPGRLAGLGHPFRPASLGPPRLHLPVRSDPLPLPASHITS